MVRASPLQANFNGGEMSPRMHARVDFARYAVGADTMVNIIPLPEGGAMRRSGSRHAAEIKNSANKARLKRFEFSTTQAYMAEFGGGYARFFRNQGQITVADTDAAISNGSFSSGITGWDDVSTGGAGNEITHDATNSRLNLTPSGTAADDIGWAEQDVSVGAAFDTNEHSLQFRVIGAPGDKIQLRIGTATTGNQIVDDVEFAVGYHVYSFTPGDGNNTIYIQFRNRGSDQNKTVQIDDVALLDNAPVEVATPYAEADLFQIEGPQTADVLYLYHNSYPTHKLTRFAHTSWSLIEVAWEDGPYLSENITATTLTPGATTGFGVTVTASSTEGINDGEGFKATDVGRSVRISNPASGTAFGWAVIVGFTNTTTVTVDIKRAFSTANATARWRLGSWSGTTGYAGNGTFFEQRLGACRSNEQPQTFWLSQSVDFENMTPDAEGDGTVDDDDALDYTIAADQVNAILWMSSGTKLALGTTGGEWIADSSGAVLTPSDIDVKRRTKHGAAQIEPVRNGDVILFTQRGKRKVREFGFKFEVDDFRARDLTILADHISRSGLVEMAFQPTPESLLWAARVDGQAALLTHSLEHDIAGWGRAIMGGSFGTGNAVIESVDTIPGNNGAGQVHDSTERDEVWMIVKRTINGQTKRYIEFLERDYEEGQDQEDAFYVDSGFTYDGAATTTITGLSALEGETVKVFADGAIHPDRTVSSGQIELQSAASVVQVGLGYTHTLKTLKVTAGATTGTAVVKPKQITEVGVVFLNSHVNQFGPDATNLKESDFREVADMMDTPVPFFSGEKEFQFDGDVEFDPRIVFQHDAPVPFTILALAPKTTTNDAL